MADPPKAHRRLVPRKPRHEDKPSENLDDDTTKQTALPARSSSRSLDSFEITGVRAGLDSDELEVTARRAPVPPGPDDVISDDLAADDLVVSSHDTAEDAHHHDDEADAAETFAHARAFVAEDPLPPGLPFGLDPASAVFAPPVPAPGPEPMVIDQPDLRSQIDPDAFADLEPTALKTSSTGDVDERPTTHISPAERGLLAAMSEGHEASRKIYMQWLERRGEKQRAEFLRLDSELAAMSPNDPRFLDTYAQLRAHAERTSVDWRSRVARSAIENCATASGCPGYWRALPADADDVRHCGVCSQEVFYCVSIDLARNRAAAGQRVAIDVTVARSASDLAVSCAGCRAVVPPGTRFCPHCGRSMYSTKV